MSEPLIGRVYRLLLTNYTLIFFVSGVALIGGSTRIAWTIPAQIARDAGISMLIGIYLMWTLERINKLRVQAEIQEYIKDVGENFIKAVYGNELPPKLFDVIRRSLFEQRFIRNVYKIDVTLQDFNETSISTAPPGVQPLLRSFMKTAGSGGLATDKLVIFRSSAYYEIENVTSIAADYRVTFEIPKPFGGSHEGLSGITSVRIAGREQIEDSVFKENADPGANPATLTYSKEVTVSPGTTIKVSLEAYSLRRNEDWEPWQTLIPSKGMDVSVTDSDGNKEIVISLDAPLLEGTEKFTTKAGRTNKAVLSTSQYLLPYQGVTLTWRPLAQDQQGR